MNITTKRTEDDHTTNSIYIFGETLFDILPDGSNVLGGAPLNVAWHLQAFGGDPNLISALGKDELGKTALTALEQWGLNTQHVELVDNHATGVVNVSIKDQANQYDIKENTAFDSADYKIPDTPPKTCFLYHGTLALREEKNQVFIKDFSASLEPKKFIDVNLRSPFWDAAQVLEKIQMAHCVKLNNEELYELLSGQDSVPAIAYEQDHLGQEQFNRDIEIHATHFKNQNQIANLIVTCGGEGAFVIDELGQIIRVEAPNSNIQITDTIGAGDAFSSIILLGMVRGWEWVISLERAQQFASYIISIKGATTDNLSIYSDFKSLWNIE